MFGKLGLVFILVQTLLVPGLVTMGPKRFGDCGRRKPMEKLNPGMVNDKGRVLLYPAKIQIYFNYFWGGEDDC